MDTNFAQDNEGRGMGKYFWMGLGNWPLQRDASRVKIPKYFKMTMLHHTGRPVLLCTAVL